MSYNIQVFVQRNRHSSIRQNDLNKTQILKFTEQHKIMDNFGLYNEKARIIMT